MYIVKKNGEIECLASHVDCPDDIPQSGMFATLVGAMRHPGAVIEPRFVYHEVAPGEGGEHRRYVTAYIGLVRITFTYTAEGLQFQESLSGCPGKDLPAKVALEAARFARRKCAVTFRPMFEFAGGEIVGNGAVRVSLAGTAIVGNALRFATHAEAYGHARHKFRFRRGIPTSGPGRHYMPLNFSVEKSLDAVNFKWCENEGTVAI